MVIITIPILAFMISGFGLGSPRAHRWHMWEWRYFFLTHFFCCKTIRHLDIDLIDCYWLLHSNFYIDYIYIYMWTIYIYTYLTMHNYMKQMYIHIHCCICVYKCTYYIIYALVLQLQLRLSNRLVSGSGGPEITSSCHFA